MKACFRPPMRATYRTKIHPLDLGPNNQQRSLARCLPRQAQRAYKEQKPLGITQQTLCHVRHAGITSRRLSVPTSTSDIVITLQQQPLPTERTQQGCTHLKKQQHNSGKSRPNRTVMPARATNPLAYGQSKQSKPYVLSHDTSVT